MSSRCENCGACGGIGGIGNIGGEKAGMGTLASGGGGSEGMGRGGIMYNPDVAKGRVCGGFAEQGAEVGDGGGGGGAGEGVGRGCRRFRSVDESGEASSRGMGESEHASNEGNRNSAGQ